MAEEPELLDRVRRAVAGRDDVEEKRMFGSIGFMVGGALRIGVGSHPDHVALVRTGAAQEEALQRPGATPAVMRGRTMRGWVFLERRAIESDEDLAYWIATSLAAV